MPDSLPWPLVVALCTAGSAIASFIVATVRVKAWLAETVIETMESRAGRDSIAAVAADRQLRIEDKLDGLARGVGEMAARLEARIDTMQQQMTTQIAKLDAETRALEIRLVRIENHQR
jgi:hypothetical protein